MPTVLDFAPAAAGPPNPKRWTRAELREMIDAGFTDLERYELFGGELIDKMGKNRPHVTSVRLTVPWLDTIAPDRCLSEAPINLRSVDKQSYRPEPDAVLLAHSFEAFTDRDPDPFEILLLIEIADTTLAFDLGEKAFKYSEAGIPEYWVVDLVNRRIVVHRDPGPERYRSILAFAEHESVAPLAAPDHAITATALLPAPTPS